MEGVEEEELGENDRDPLEEEGLRGGVVEGLETDQGRVPETRGEGEGKLEPGKEGRVVEGPGGVWLVDVPVLEGREAVGEREPVPVDLQVCREAVVQLSKRVCVYLYVYF